MRLLFLDFDGVLNSHAYQASLLESPETVSALMGLDPGAVQRLNRLVRVSEARVVITSSWRLLHSPEALSLELQKVGFEHPQSLLGVTPSECPVTRLVREWPGPTPFQERARLRGNQIQSWLEANRILPKSMAILDDDSDMGPYRPYLIKTSFDVGLTEADVDRAIALLATPYTIPVASGFNWWRT